MPIVYTLWHYDYEQTSMYGVYSTPEKAAASWWATRHANPKLRDDYWNDFGIQAYRIDSEENIDDLHIKLQDYPDPTITIGPQTL